MRRAIALPIAVVAVLTLAATVLAGGWATVAAAGPTDGHEAGADTIVELEVLQHGVTAVSWPRITVTATNQATGEIVEATAVPTAGKTGQYAATLTFPTEGSWTLSYDSPDLVMEGTATLAVSAPVAAAVSGVANASTAATAAAVDPAVVGIVGAAILILVAMLAGFLVLRERRPERGKQTTAVGG
jgi:hypothetical protein